jgi:hypothetical protein
VHSVDIWLAWAKTPVVLTYINCIVHAAEAGGDVAAVELRIKRTLQNSHEETDAMKYVSEKTMLDEWKWSRERVNCVKKHCFEKGKKFWKYDKYEKNLQLFLVTKEETVTDKQLMMDVCEAEMALDPSSESALHMLECPTPLFICGAPGKDDDDDKGQVQGKAPKSRGSKRTSDSIASEESQSKPSKKGKGDAKGEDKAHLPEYRAHLIKSIMAATETRMHLSPVPFTKELLAEVEACIQEMEVRVGELDSLTEESGLENYREVYATSNAALHRWTAALQSAQSRIRQARPAKPKDPAAAKAKARA